MLIFKKKNLSSGAAEQGPTRAWDIVVSVSLSLPTATFNYNRTHSMTGFSPISQHFNKLVTSVAAMRVFIQNA